MATGGPGRGTRRRLSLPPRPGRETVRSDQQLRATPLVAVQSGQEPKDRPASEGRRAAKGLTWPATTTRPATSRSITAARRRGSTGACEGRWQMTARIRSRQIARLVWAAALCTVVASARGQAVATVTFSQSPWAIKAGDNVGITFAVSAPTDVEVAILAGVALVGPDEMQGRPGQLQGARVHRGAPRRQPSRPGPGRLVCRRRGRSCG